MIASTSSHSSDVRIRLKVGGRSLNVAQVGRDFCILRERIITEPTNAELLISIDGQEDSRQVYLPDGITDEMELVRLVK